jgi:hypothetical protein
MCSPFRFHPRTRPNPFLENIPIRLHRHCRPQTLLKVNTRAIRNPYLNPILSLPISIPVLPRAILKNIFPTRQLRPVIFAPGTQGLLESESETGGPGRGGCGFRAAVAVGGEEGWDKLDEEGAEGHKGGAD